MCRVQVTNKYIYNTNPPLLDLGTLLSLLSLLARGTWKYHPLIHLLSKWILENKTLKGALWLNVLKTRGSQKPGCLFQMRVGREHKTQNKTHKDSVLSDSPTATHTRNLNKFFCHTCMFSGLTPIYPLTTPSSESHSLGHLICPIPPIQNKHLSFLLTLFFLPH